MGIAAQVAVCQRVVPGQVAIIAAEPVAPVIAHPALLRAPLGRLDGAHVRLDTEIAVREMMHRPACKAADLAAEDPPCPIDPVIQAINKAIHACLVIVRGEAGE